MTNVISAAYPGLIPRSSGWAARTLTAQLKILGTACSAGRAWVNPFYRRFSIDRSKPYRTCSHPDLPSPSCRKDRPGRDAKHGALLTMLKRSTTRRKNTPGVRRIPVNATCITTPHIGAFNVTGTTDFTFTPVDETIRMTPATDAWTGSTSVLVEPEPGYRWSCVRRL